MPRAGSISTDTGMAVFGVVHLRAAGAALTVRIEPMNTNLVNVHADIIRLIRNSHREHRVCALARGRYGLEDYGRLGNLLEEVASSRLAEFLDEIDEVRASHASCRPCSLKFLAFCRIYTMDRLPERHAAYGHEYEALYRHRREDRDFMAEAQSAIRVMRQLPKFRPNQAHWFRNLEFN